jgi:hypothetical protein
MPLDEYDYTVSKYDFTIDIYDYDDVSKIVKQFLCEISTKTNSDREKLSAHVEDVISKLRNVLAILDSRIVTNIGGKVACSIVPEVYDQELGFFPRWILVQVHRGPRN